MTLIDTNTKIEILNSIVTPSLIEYGFKSNSEYLWFTNWQNGIRKIVKYENLKGEQGTLIWGVCFDFIPMISSNSIKWNRTEKSISLHLFDSTEEYVNSFDGKKMTDGVASHWGEMIFEKSLQNLLFKNQDKIQEWFSNCNHLNGLIEIANNQINSQKAYYRFHHPNPQYVLMFLLAKIGQTDESLKIFDKVITNLTVKDKIRKLITNE